ncbi:PQQ-dependent sugar dehydrogenase [Dietzia massiliensis]|uniref:PQQ-dependent sugar dehydrogenase n=1 Tax=Dietzia massiliensis TaxID=2697499 RepID=UPI001BD12152|nr:PQQ-dependent sugar dehydrogenase [Dietzia massiliensis]MBS7549013.1 PQQ-dependent sugar dehydrogenase [Dietzia massiliensis]
MPDRPERRPVRSILRARLLAGVATAAAVSVAAPVTALAQGSVPAPPVGSVDAGSLGSTGSSGSAGSLGSAGPGGETLPPPLKQGPAVEVEVVLDGLTIPWDVVRDPDGVVVTGERGTGKIVAARPDGTRSDVEADLGRLFTGGESGLMGIALAHDFATSREVYTCHSDDDADDSRVTAWRAADDWSRLDEMDVIVSGIARQDIGHHSGCRILAHPDGTLYIGTGDTFHGSVPQDLRSLGGKVLHVKRDGAPADDTIREEGANPRILTYGHRNVQGLALQPGTGRIYSAEHGTLVDDEINLILPGKNYGWDPYRPGIPRDHDDASPMTDLEKFPDAMEAVWSSGDPTWATSGITFLDHPSWREWNGALAVAMLKSKRIALMRLSDDGLEVTDTVEILADEHGRIRSLTSEPDGTILATTSNGNGRDEVLRIRPAVAE